jgi:hypothetical protein
MTSHLRLLTLALLLVPGLAAADPSPAHGPGSRETVLNTFEDAAKEAGDWKGIGATVSIEPIAVTDGNLKLKMVATGDSYPGINRTPPRDWRGHEVLRFRVWSGTAYELQVRIDDDFSKDYPTQFNFTFKLKKGENLCQVRVVDIGKRLQLDRIKALVLFTIKPPPGLVLYFDDVVLGNALSEQVPFIPYAQRKDLIPSLAVTTPHLPFGRGLAGGPRPIFFQTSVFCGREIPELMQRLDLQVSQLTWDRYYDCNTWGFGDFYHQRGHAIDVNLMQEYFASSMQGPERFAALVLANTNGWLRYTQGAREALVRRVTQQGEGLVFVYPWPGGDSPGAAWPQDLQDVCALIGAESDYLRSSGYFSYPKGEPPVSGVWRRTADHPITRGVPLEAIPMANISIRRYTAAPGAQVLLETTDGTPVLAVRQVGKARLVTFAWISNGATPEIHAPDTLLSERPYRYQEALYSLMARAILWASGHDFPRTGAAVELPVAGGNASPHFTTRQWKDAAGAVTDWELEFHPPGATGVAAVTLEAPCDLTVGDPLAIAFSLPEAAQGGQVTLSLVEEADGRRRTLESLELAATAGRMTGTLPSGRVRQALARVEVQARKGDALLAEGRAEVVVSPRYRPGESRWQDYEVLMWPNPALPFLQPLEDRMMKAFGATGVMDTEWQPRERCLRWARAGLRLMVHDFARKQLQISHNDFSELAARFNRTGDRALLVRNPSYADPAFLAAERERVRDVVRTLKPFNPTNYITCDEPSLTSYAKDFDFDLHPENIRLFRQRLEEKFGTIAALNAALSTNSASFAVVEPPLSSQKQWPLWNEWRAHNDRVMADGYRLYREAVESVDPNGTISISGTQVATSFNGFDWSQLSQHFGTMQGYGYSHQNRQRLSFRPDMLNAVPAGYGRSGKAVDHQVWSELLLNGGGHVLFWWIAFRNPDLSLSSSAQDYRRVFAEMTSGTGKQYMQAQRAWHPVGIAYSMNSLRAVYATGDSEGRHSLYHKRSDALCDDLLAAGYDPVFISDAQIAAGELTSRGLKALFLPACLSLGYGDRTGGLAVKPALEAFLKAGGLVVATHEPEMDEFLRPRTPEPAFWKQVRMYDSLKPDLGAALGRVGVLPWAEVRNPQGGRIAKLEVAVHRLRGEVAAHIVTVVRPPAGMKEKLGADGVVTMVPDAEAGNAVEPAVLKLQGLGQPVAYDLRGGYAAAKDGATTVETHSLLPTRPDTYTFDALAGDARCFALLPYRVEGLELTAQREHGDLVITWRLAGAKAFAPHVVRIEAGELGAGGFVPDAVFSRNEVTPSSGQGRLSLPLAREDGDRRLSVRVRDLLSGLTRTIAVR